MVKKVLKSRELEKHLALEDKVNRVQKATSKVGMLSDGSTGVLNKKIMDARAAAQSIIEDAECEAEKIRLEAKELLDQVGAELKKTREAGFKKGHEEGLAGVTGMVASFEKAKEEFMKNAEENIIRLVMMIAEKIIGKMVNEHADAIKSVVKQAIESALGEKILVRLNPEDFKIVKASEPEFVAIIDKTKRINFRQDEDIARGGCVVETEVGTIDARLETQLKAIRKALEL